MRLFKSLVLSRVPPTATRSAQARSVASLLRLSRSFSTCQKLLVVSPDEKELAEARNWLKRFQQHQIPRNICDLSFSRSGGPGGQNVNKVNSKVTLRVPIKKLEAFVPKIFIQGLRSTPRYLANHDTEVVISSDLTRSQLENTEDCYKKLYQTIASSVKIPGEPSTEQKEHVKRLDKAYNEKRLKMKQKHSSKKSARRGDEY